MRNLFLAMVLLAATSLCAHAAPKITANVNPVMLSAGETQGATIIAWDAENEKNAEVWQQVDSAKETRFSSNEKGTQATIIVSGKKHTFKLYKDGQRKAVLASVVVTAQAAAAPVVVDKPALNPRTVARVARIGPSFQQARMLYDVYVSATTQNATIAFSTSEQGPALVEIGTVKPVLDEQAALNGKIVWGFPVGKSRTSRFVTPQGSRAILNLSKANEELEVGTTYFYIINVFNDDKRDTKLPRVQEQGAFTTRNQTVKVIWEKIHVVNDSDPNGKGELYFTLWANYATGAGKFVSANGEWTDGQWVPVNASVTLDGVPDTLTLHANGLDEDTLGYYFGAEGEAPHTGPGMNDDEEWNVARGEFDLSKHSGDFVKVPFLLRSLPNGADKGDLQFEVTGYVEINRSGAQTMSTRNAPSTEKAPGNNSVDRFKNKIKDQIRIKNRF